MWKAVWHLHSLTLCHQPCWHLMARTMSQGFPFQPLHLRAERFGAFLSCRLPWNPSSWSTISILSIYTHFMDFDPHSLFFFLDLPLFPADALRPLQQRTFQGDLSFPSICVSLSASAVCFSAFISGLSSAALHTRCFLQTSVTLIISCCKKYESWKSSFKLHRLGCLFINLRGEKSSNH